MELGDATDQQICRFFSFRARSLRRIQFLTFVRVLGIIEHSRFQSFLRVLHVTTWFEQTFPANMREARESNGIRESRFY